ncbi:MAG: STAS/SEC14 domain-containing protein [Thermodesulfobacteriota bacterium]
MTLTFKGTELTEEGKFIHLKITGILETEDYEFFVPKIDQQIERFGKVNMLMELIDFHGWTAGAAWEDTKFGIRHFNDIERLAIVGNKAWEKGMAYFCKVFMNAKVQYFDIREKDKAITWICS